MAPIKFDIPGDPPAFLLSEQNTSAQVLDLDGNPNLVIEAGTGFNVKVHWELTGVLAPLVINDWHVRLFAESIGAGFEGKLAEVTSVVASPIGGGVAYDVTLNVPAALTNTLVDAAGDGVYGLVVVLTHDNVFNLRDTLAGFSNGMIIEVRKP